MGSSRSGLVESPIASLGTRTGFYTDDFNEQDFKSPEEIRKANLRPIRGQNLRSRLYLLTSATHSTTRPGTAARSRAILSRSPVTGFPNLSLQKHAAGRRM